VAVTRSHGFAWQDTTAAEGTMSPEFGERPRDVFWRWPRRTSWLSRGSSPADAFGCRWMN